MPGVRLPSGEVWPAIFNRARWRSMRVRPGPSTVLAFGALVVLAGCFGGGRNEGDVDEGGTPSSSASSSTTGGSLPPGPRAAAATPLFHRAGGAPANASDYPGEAPAFRLSTLPGVWAWEPSIGVDASGTIYYAAAANTTSGDQVVHVLRSTDQGETWTVIVPGALPEEVPPNRFTNDPYLAVDAVRGRVWVGHLRAECNTLHFSDDGGEAWVTNPAACSHPFEDRPILVPGPLATPTGPLETTRVLYLCSNQIVVSTCSRSLDGGVSFQAIPPPYGNDPACGPVTTGFLATNGAVSPTTGAFFLARRTTCGLVSIAHTADNGATWSHAALATGPRGEGCGPDAVLAADAAGNVFLAFLDAACLPVLAWSQDGGATWSASAAVGRPGLAQASHLGLVAGAAGKVALSYMGTSDPQANGTARLWSLHVAMTLDGFAAGGAVFVTADAGGRPLVAGAYAGGAGIGAGLNGVGDFLGLARDPSSYAVVAAAVDVCAGPCSIPAGDPPSGRAAIAVQRGGTTLA